MARARSRVAALQASYGHDMEANIAKTATLVREARPSGRAGRSCRRSCSRAPTSATRRTRSGSRRPSLARASVRHRAGASWPRELGVVIPISFFEKRRAALLQQRRDGRRRRLDPRRLSQEPHPRRARLSGEVLLPARRHRLQGRGRRSSARIGVGICWDQWYPEAARAMVLMGAEVLLYPTAIGSEPHDPTLDTARAVAARHAGPRRLQRRAGRRGQPHRRSRTTTASTQSYLWPLASSPTIAASSSRVRRCRRGSSGRDLRPRRNRTLPRRLGLLPRPPHRPLREDSDLVQFGG